MGIEGINLFDEIEVLDTSEFYAIFNKSIEMIKKLVEIDLVDPELNTHLYYLLYANVITAMETYLLEALVKTSISKDEWLVNFTKNYDEAKKKRVTYEEALGNQDKIRQEIVAYMKDIIFHNLPKVSNVYKFTLDIDLPKNISEIMTAVNLRHHIVHRNGKDKSGDKISITKDDVNNMIHTVSSYIRTIDSKIAFLVQDKTDEEVQSVITKDHLMKGRDR